MTIRSAAVTALAASAAGAVLVPAAGAADGPTSDPAGQKVLSDERLESRWAYPARRALVRTRPTREAKKVTRLRLFTEDQLPELYLTLSQWRDPTGRAWVKVRLPMRPNGRTGWVVRDALGPFNVVRTHLRVNRRALRATLYESGKRIWSARVGVGKQGTVTPRGRFYIREKFRVRGFPLYGTHAIGTSAYAPTLSDWPGGGIVGLHGTNQPGLIPGRPSHGCVRFRNRDIARLFRLLPRGTPLQIL